MPDGKSDVYVAVRSIAGLMKISLHESGMCNASITKQAARHPSIVARLGASRHLDQWHRPVKTEGRVLSIPLRIRFLERELRERREAHSPQSEDFNWLAPPDADRAVDVLCIFTSSAEFTSKSPWRTPGSSLLAQKELPNGETFWIACQYYRPQRNLVQYFNRQKTSDLWPNSRVVMADIGPANVRILTDAASDHSVE